MGLFSPSAVSKKLASLFSGPNRNELQTPAGDKDSSGRGDRENSGPGLSDSKPSEGVPIKDPVQGETKRADEHGSPLRKEISREASETIEEASELYEKDSEGSESAEDRDAEPPRETAETPDLEEEYFRNLLDRKSEDAELPPKSDIVEPKSAEPEDNASLKVAEAEREVFVGNVPYKVIMEKRVYGAFKRHLAEGANGKVEKIRFRSIAFSEALPRRAAYIKQKLHPSRDAVNAYVRFTAEDHAKRALVLNGSIFEDHHLRLDSVAHPAAQDNKRTVFVGNLDFEATEESLWQHFGGCGVIENVRIIRDTKTNVGKGFAYVQFRESPAVQPALMLDSKELGKRRLRVTHAKKSFKRHQPTQRAPAKARKDVRLEKSADASASKRPVAIDRTGANREKSDALEGQRAKVGDSTSLGRKRKVRHAASGTNRRAKRARK